MLGTHQAELATPQARHSSTLAKRKKLERYQYIEIIKTHDYIGNRKNDYPRAPTSDGATLGLNNT